MESVYIETTIVSYLISRPSRDLLVASHQQLTYDWWTRRRRDFDCYVSQAVIDEIAAGDADAAEERLKAIMDLPVLEATERAQRLAAAIVASGAMPVRAIGDAAHVAIAAASDVEYLLTWNCNHLANAQVMRKVSVVCTAQGFNMPLICTPEELMGD